MRLRWLIATCVLCHGPTAAVAESAAEDTTPPAPAPATAVDITAHVDAYGLVDWRFPVPQDNTGPIRANDFASGFALAWGGLDAALSRGPIGGKVSLRYGPSVPRALGAGDFAVKEAFATWRPARAVSLDFGVFDTPYGAEGLDSFRNQHYTVGAVSYFAQPTFHSGLRATVEIADGASIAGVIVNGWNQYTDNNRGKSAGVQLTFQPLPSVTAIVGYIGGPEQDDEIDTDANSRLRHFFDAIAIVELGRTEIWANADVGFEEQPAGDTVMWWGAMVSVSHQVAERVKLAGRAEVLADPDGFLLGLGDVTVGTLTATIDYRPLPELILRLDNRVDVAGDPIFPDGRTGAADTGISTVLGVVVTAP